MNAIFIAKFWRESAIAALLIVIFAQLAYTNYLSGKLQKARVVSDLRVQAHIDAFSKVIQKQQADANKVALRYEKWRGSHQQKNGVIRNEVIKIINRHIYRNVCFDADGVSAINRAISAADSPDKSAASIPAVTDVAER